jgi:hypothetical protein
LMRSLSSLDFAMGGFVVLHKDGDLQYIAQTHCALSGGN